MCIPLVDDETCRAKAKSFLPLYNGSPGPRLSSFKGVGSGTAYELAQGDAALVKASTSSVPVVSLDELERDVHGVFRQHRRTSACIARSDGLLILLRAVDIRRLVADPRLAATPPLVSPGPIDNFISGIMLYSAGESHLRRRTPFLKTLAFQAVTKLRGDVRAIAEKLVESWAHEARAELVSQFASRLPVLVIGKILGFPERDLPRFARLAASAARFLRDATCDRAELPRMERDICTLEQDLERLLSDRLANPRDDFLTSFVLAVTDQQSLTLGEAVAQIATVLVAATDTTRIALAAQVVLLLAHPGQWAAIREEPSRLRGAVLEALRFEPSVGSYYRLCLEDVAVEDYVIPAGSTIMLSAMSALRDEAIYTAPDKFDIYRSDHPRGNLGFGGGPHRCLGEALALIELEESLGVLARRFPAMRLEGAPSLPRGYSGIRQIGPVPVAWT